MKPAIPTAEQIEDLAIYKGAKWEHVLTFTDDVGAPLNLTGLAPFVITFTKPLNDFPLVDATIANTNLAGGVLTVSLTAAQSDAFRIGEVRMGLTDALDNAYVQVTLPVRYLSKDRT